MRTTLKIEKKNVTEQVVAYLRENIESGNWKVGEKIPSENQLTTELSVSRASLRAAIGQLVGLGILESVHGKGTFLKESSFPDTQEDKITSQDCKDMGKVLEFRRILETESCRLAVKNRTDSLIRELEECCREMKKQEQADRELFIAADMKFHQLIAAASGNPLIEKSLYRIFNETIRNHRQMNTIFGYESGLYHHSRILECFRRGDAEGGARCMYEHMQSAIDALPEEFPGTFVPEKKGKTDPER